MIVPITTIAKQEKQLIGAGYKVERKKLLDHSQQYIEVFNPDEDIVDGHQRKVVFLYDGTGNILEKLSVVITPYELNHEKEQKVF
ncbi:hypothetical protein [Aquimarina aggregata]|uniref:hypothetical protein n=1 Tax=Aquimarina aggregata TaxID=1642818 RepID=UPI0012FD1F5C|nr:hypothetical protein [Aquimarina aggregata]